MSQSLPYFTQPVVSKTLTTDTLHFRGRRLELLIVRFPLAALILLALVLAQ